MVVEPSRGIVVVADGMGGAPAGDVASAMAVQEVAKGLHAGRCMEDSIQGANKMILELSESQPAFAGMGTTLTALDVNRESGRYVLGHVGDSRAYLLSEEGFSQLSRDHTMVRDMVEAGKIPASAEREHPLAHILSRALGTAPQVDVDVLEGHVRAGDCFLLCSDGLVKVMEEEEVETWVRRAGSDPLEEIVDAMLEEANRRGAPDNVTVAFLVVAGSG
jgi:protein phosphatase